MIFQRLVQFVKSLFSKPTTPRLDATKELPAHMEMLLVREMFYRGLFTAPEALKYDALRTIDIDDPSFILLQQEKKKLQKRVNQFFQSREWEQPYSSGEPPEPYFPRTAGTVFPTYKSADKDKYKTQDVKQRYALARNMAGVIHDEIVRLTANAIELQKTIDEIECDYDPADLDASIAWKNRFYKRD